MSWLTFEQYVTTKAVRMSHQPGEKVGKMLQSFENCFAAGELCEGRLQEILHE